MSRWNLSSKDDSKSPTGQSLWTHTYYTLRAARNNAAQRYNKDRKAHQFKAGDTVMYKKHLVNPKVQNIC